MNKWQKNFLRDLDQLKSQWQHRFETVAENWLTPVFEEFEAFAARNGFLVTCPHSGGGARAFKFALEENAYVLCCFQQVGVGQIEARAEVFVPGQGNLEPFCEQANLGEVNESWFRRRFEEALDRFVSSFAQAGTKSGVDEFCESPVTVTAPA
ncbi:MAG: hypothetical protein IID37_11165 [Planctomycetes bacterium]|nr:hypothetical protein [Planctomycetota bacterium]